MHQYGSINRQDTLLLYMFYLHTMFTYIHILNFRDNFQLECIHFTTQKRSHKDKHSHAHIPHVPET